MGCDVLMKNYLASMRMLVVLMGLALLVARAVQVALCVHEGQDPFLLVGLEVAEPDDHEEDATQRDEAGPGPPG